MNRAIFLDRDNTIIHNDGDLGDPDQVKLIQGAASAIASMRGLGYQIIVVSNQGGVARGKYSEPDVDAVHQHIANMLHEQANGTTVERFYYCPYHPDGSVPGYRREHPWRKPQPGMLLQGAEDMNLDMELCWMVGDQLRDIEAGHAAGVRTVLLAEPDEVPALLADAKVKPSFTARNLIEAARVIAQHLRPTQNATQTVSPAISDLSLVTRLSGEKISATQSLATTTPTKKTYPAKHDLGAHKTTGKQSNTIERPFKPWDIQPVSSDDEQPLRPEPVVTRTRGLTVNIPQSELPSTTISAEELATKEQSAVDARASNAEVTQSPSQSPTQSATKPASKPIVTKKSKSTHSPNVKKSTTKQVTKKQAAKKQPKPEQLDTENLAVENPTVEKQTTPKQPVTESTIEKTVESTTVAASVKSSPVEPDHLTDIDSKREVSRDDQAHKTEDINQPASKTATIAPRESEPIFKLKSAEVSQSPIVTSPSVTSSGENLISAESRNETRLLEQILQQLKKPQVDYADWSSLKLLAMALVQPAAIACLVIGLLFAGDNAPFLLNWLVGAGVAQLMVITLLILHWQK